MEAPGLGGTRGEGHHCPHCPLRVTLGGVRDVCPQPACCAFPSPGPADALSACTVQSALLSLHLFLISRHLPSTFSLCFSLIRQSLSASLGRGRSEFAEIVGATCNNPPPSVLLPPVHTRAGTPPAPPCPRTVLGTGHPQPALLQAIPLGAALTMRVTAGSPLLGLTSACWSLRISLFLLPGCRSFKTVVQTSLLQTDNLSCI